MSGRGSGGGVALIHDFLLDVRGAERVSSSSACAHGVIVDPETEGVTGAFFDRPDAAELVRALQAFDPRSVDPARCQPRRARGLAPRLRPAGARQP